MIKLSKVTGFCGAVLGLAGLAVMLAGCAGTPPTRAVAVPPGAADATNFVSSIQSGTEVLGVGDTVTVTYNDLPMLTPPFEGQIKADGSITLMLNQKFTAAGKTRGELEQEIRKRYVPDYFKNMTVNVNVRSDTRLYYVGGEVRSPGGRMYISRITVLKAIQSAGDFTEFANRKKVKLTRADGSKPIIINVTKVLSDPTKDVEVFPGDTIHVPKKFW